MKRFLLFTGYDYYPRGGWHDFAGSFDTIQEAKDADYAGDWFQVIDSTTGEEVG